MEIHSRQSQKQKMSCRSICKLPVAKYIKDFQILFLKYFFFAHNEMNFLIISSIFKNCPVVILSVFRELAVIITSSLGVGMWLSHAS